MSKSQGGLTQWFQEKWVDLSRPKKGGGFEPCGRDDAKSGKYPKCVPAARAARMTPEQIESAIRRKRMAESREKREDKKPIMVETVKKENVPADPELYARVKAEAKKKFDVYPSAYANGWLVAEYKRRGGKYKVEKYNPHHDEKGRFSSRGSARTVVPAKLSDNAPAQLKVLADKGGFTFNPKKNQLRRKGIAVAIAKKYELPVDEKEFAKNGEKIIKDYMRQYSEVLAKPNAHLGAWKDKGKVYLDISIVKGSLDEAASIGRANDQIGIFDLATFTTWNRMKVASGEYKYFPSNTPVKSNLGMVNLGNSMVLESFGKADGNSGVVFVAVTDLLDDESIRLFVKKVNEMESIKKDEPTSADTHVPTALGRVQVIRDRQRKLKKKRMAMDAALAKKEPLKDPKGGLTAAGRKHFKQKEGANLRPGVRGKADTPEKMRRKGSFLTRFFTNPSGPMTKPNGEPTRLALSAAAWGEPVPKNRSDAAKLAEKGRNLLERYDNAKKK